MLHKSRAFVLKSTLYGDTSIIAQCFLEDIGFSSFIVSGVRKAKAGTNASLFEIGNILEIVFYKKDINALQRIKEVRYSIVPNTISQDFAKQMQRLFIAEFVLKAFQNEPHSVDLFSIIYNNIAMLEKPNENNHVITPFLFQCMQAYGIYDAHFFGNISTNNRQERKALIEKQLKHFVAHQFDEKILQMHCMEVLEML